MSKILWIEDASDQVRGHVKSLKLHGHSVELCTTGGDAVQILLDRPAEFDLMFLDCILPPGKNDPLPDATPDERRGIEVLRYVRAHGSEELPPIVVISCVDLWLSLEEPREGHDPAIVAMEGKPVSLDRLKELIDNYGKPSE